MKKTFTKFGDTEVKKKFHQHEKPVSINNIDNNKIVLSNAKSLSVKKDFEYFIGFRDV